MAGKVKRALNIRGSMVPIPSPVLWLFSLLWYVVRLLAGRCWAGLLWLSSSCATAVTRAFERIGRKSTRNTGERNQTRTASRCSPRKRMPPWVSLFPSISSPEIDQHETKLLLSQFHRCTFPSFLRKLTLSTFVSYRFINLPIFLRSKDTFFVASHSNASLSSL